MYSPPSFSRVKLRAVAWLTGIALSLPQASFALDYTPEQLGGLSLEQLANSTVLVSSVARREGSVQGAPAAVTVLTQEDIRRSGATCVPEVLRMVPGLDVARVDSHQWAISSRGFNDLFANKLLVMVDGRSVYASIFSGTFWDVQDLMLEDVERIEVIRGPGAALWGANAVNGVINILTKKAAATQGVLVSGGAGNEDRGLGAIRYGGTLGPYLHYRVYGKYSDRGDSALLGTGFPESLVHLDLGGAGSGSAGSLASPPRSAQDSWRMGRTGFRVDFDPPGADQITLQGDWYKGFEDQLYEQLTPVSFGTFLDYATDTVSGGNLLARWTHTFSSTSHSILQTYYDRNDRNMAVLGDHSQIFDVDFQHQFALWDRQTIVWGGGYRRVSDKTDSTMDAAFMPVDRATDQFNAFLQDEIALVKNRLALTLGSRFEHNDFTGFELEPNARLAWTPNSRNTVWISVSRALRTPSRAESDIQLNYPGIPKDMLFAGSPAITIGLRGNPDFLSEELTAYEAGYRAQLSDRLSVDVAAFYSEYRKIRNFALDPSSVLDFTKSPVEINIGLTNQATAETYGGEISANLRVTNWWRLRADYSLLQMFIHSEGNINVGSFGPSSIAASNPQNQIALRSYMEFPHGFEFDATLRYVDELSALAIPAYAALDLRLGWHPCKNVEFSIGGQNLLDNRHPEFRPGVFGSQATQVARSIYGKVTIQF